MPVSNSDRVLCSGVICYVPESKYICLAVQWVGNIYSIYRLICNIPVQTAWLASRLTIVLLPLNQTMAALCASRWRRLYTFCAIGNAKHNVQQHLIGTKRSRFFVVASAQNPHTLLNSASWSSRAQPMRSLMGFAQYSRHRRAECCCCCISATAICYTYTTKCAQITRSVVFTFAITATVEWVSGWPSIIICAPPRYVFAT